jgi:hypothetical protein
MRILTLANFAIWATGPGRAQTYDPHFPVCM